MFVIACCQVSSLGNVADFQYDPLECTSCAEIDPRLPAIRSLYSITVCLKSPFSAELPKVFQILLLVNLFFYGRSLYVCCRQKHPLALENHLMMS
jgi:hypothetical protein